ncbi:hypothetical protein ACFYWO_32465 [Streptomyces sp. NPDC002932]|uniref:hypothetical protein n=1 Tax=Streptomyces sp. NPDC002932 TaxID=3364672 RepID=UPI0036C67F8B
MEPKGAPKRHAALAGPGQLSPDAGVDVLLVPVHPRTGQTWTPASPTASAYLVPLPLGRSSSESAEEVAVMPGGPGRVALTGR